MFVQKTRNLEKLGAVGMIVLDNNPDSSASVANMFSMSGDGTNDINIPVLFLYGKEASILLDVLRDSPDVIVHLMPGTSASRPSTETKSSTVSPSIQSKNLKEDDDLSKKVNNLLKAVKISSLMDDLNEIGIALGIKGKESSSKTGQSFDKQLSSLNEMARNYLSTFKDVVDDPSVYINSRKFLESIGFSDELIQRRTLNSCLNPRNNPQLFLSFISRQDWKRRVIRRTRG